MRRGPAPEHPAPQPAEPEIMADVRARKLLRVNPARERLVGGGQQRPDERRLTDGPAGAGDSPMAGDVAGNNQHERQRERHQPANRCGGKHPFAQHRTAGGTEIKPVKTGADERERERDEHRVPENHPPLETAEEVAGQRGEELLHAENWPINSSGDQLKSTDCSSQLRVTFMKLNFRFQIIDKCRTSHEKENCVCFCQIRLVKHCMANSSFIAGVSIQF